MMACDVSPVAMFFLEIESMIAKTNFTLGPIEKSIFFSSVIMLYFSIN